MRELLAGLVPGLPPAGGALDRRPRRRHPAVRGRDRPDARRRRAAARGRRPLRAGRRARRAGRARDAPGPDRGSARRPRPGRPGARSRTRPCSARASRSRGWRRSPATEPATPRAAAARPRSGASCSTQEVDPRSPERGQYAFVQALIREVAYSTLAKRDRRSRHLAAARFFESLGEDELAGALAGHYLAAWQAAPDGPEGDAVAVQARLALVGAAERALEPRVARERRSASSSRRSSSRPIRPSERRSSSAPGGPPANAVQTDAAEAFLREAIEHPPRDGRHDRPCSSRPPRSPRR